MIWLLPLVGAVILIWEGIALKFAPTKTVTNFIRTQPHLALILGGPLFLILGFALGRGGP